MILFTIRDLIHRLISKKAKYDSLFEILYEGNK